MTKLKHQQNQQQQNISINIVIPNEIYNFIKADAEQSNHDINNLIAIYLTKQAGKRKALLRLLGLDSKELEIDA